MKSSKSKPAQIFRPDSDWKNNACIFVRNRDPYIAGYLRAGELLLSHVVDNSRDQDTLLYPIVFVYRHGLELLLKEIIESGRQLQDEPSESVHGHKLEQLWPIARDILRRIWDNSEDPSEFQTISYVVDEFAKHDPQADAFRYPKNSRNKTNLAHLRMVNLRLFGDNIVGCCALLEGAVLGIEEYLQLKGEAQNQT